MTRTCKVFQIPLRDCRLAAVYLLLFPRGVLDSASLMSLAGKSKVRSLIKHESPTIDVIGGEIDGALTPSVNINLKYFYVYFIFGCAGTLLEHNDIYSRGSL